jgi:uncharacterized membrane protein
VTGAYAKPLTLKVEGQPSGVTATIAPASIAPGTGKATATIAPALTATPGNYTLVLSTNAADGSPTQSLPITLTVKPPTTFFLTSSQPSLKILQGTSGRLTLTTAHSGAFASAVVLSQSGLPTSATVSFSSTTIGSPGDGTSMLTIRTAVTTPAANYNVVVKATGGGVAKTVTIPVTVTPLPNFSFTANKTAISVGQTQSGVVGLTVNGLVGGFSSAVNLSASGLPTGVTASFTPASIGAPGSGTASMTLSASSNAPTGKFALVVSATGAGVTKTVALTLTVTPPPNFTLAGTVSFKISPGATVTSRITSTGVYGFSSPVTLSCSSLPAASPPDSLRRVSAATEDPRR